MRSGLLEYHKNMKVKGNIGMTRKLIQYISYSENENMDGEFTVLSKFSDPRSLDEFEITVIDFSNSSIWVGDTERNDSLYCQNDLNNLSVMISQSKKTKVVFLYPQDCTFCYDPWDIGGQTELHSSIELKNMLDVLERDIINDIFDIPQFGLKYENTKTKIGEIEAPASFYFSETECELTKSELSNKVTTTEYDGIVLSTLLINSYDVLIDFLHQVRIIQNKEDVPEWIFSIDMFDDVHQKQIIEQNTTIIENAKKTITEAQLVINKNNEYKSILYTNGDELVAVIFGILQQVLDCDLSKFIDEKKEDFNINSNDITFIGEIKGVTSNIKSEHISQLDVHLQSYLDKLLDEGKNENVKSLLIINHQRTKKIGIREPVHKNQIDLAKRNGSLIIETITLLKLFENYLNNRIDNAAIKKLFAEEKGLLRL